jgi:hypothetical protein
MLKINLKFKIEDHFGPPMCRIIIDDSAPTYDGPVLPEMSFSIPIIAGEHELRIVHYGKTNDDHLIENGVILKDKHFELTDLHLDDVALGAELWEGAFFPVYGQDYVEDCKKNNIKLQYSICPNLYFGHNGSWRLNFVYPIYTWLISRRENGPKLENSIFQTSEEILKKAKDYFSSVPDIKWDT